MKPQSSYPYQARDEFKEMKETELYYEAQASIKPRERKDNEMVVTESIEGTLPTTKIICGKCKHNEATFYLRQTRAADEPTTRFYQCTKCKHRWREY